jgi:hypothetical protein
MFYAIYLLLLFAVIAISRSTINTYKKTEPSLHKSEQKIFLSLGTESKSR